MSEMWANPCPLRAFLILEKAKTSRELSQVNDVDGYVTDFLAR
jgi:hypothetical protein